MKPRTRRLLAGFLAGAWLLVPIPRVERAAGQPAADSPTPVPTVKGDGRKKRRVDGGSSTPTPAATKGGGSIPLPLPIGRPGVNVTIPDMDSAGKLLSLLIAQKATPLDEDRVKMEGLHMDFKKADGKQDFHVVMPASIFNLKTHIVTSDDPVTISTQDFTLTGEKMEFNTLEREGRLIGHVRMVVHNLQKFTGQIEPDEKPNE